MDKIVAEIVRCGLRRASSRRRKKQELKVLPTEGTAQEETSHLGALVDAPDEVSDGLTDEPSLPQEYADGAASSANLCFPTSTRNRRKEKTDSAASTPERPGTLIACVDPIQMTGYGDWVRGRTRKGSRRGLSSSVRGRASTEGPVSQQSPSPILVREVRRRRGRSSPTVMVVDVEERRRNLLELKLLPCTQETDVVALPRTGAGASWWGCSSRGNTLVCHTPHSTPALSAPVSGGSAAFGRPPGYSSNGRPPLPGTLKGQGVTGTWSACVQGSSGEGCGDEAWLLPQLLHTSSMPDGSKRGPELSSLQLVLKSRNKATHSTAKSQECPDQQRKSSLERGPSGGSLPSPICGSLVDEWGGFLKQRMPLRAEDLEGMGNPTNDLLASSGQIPSMQTTGSSAMAESGYSFAFFGASTRSLSALRGAPDREQQLFQIAGFEKASSANRILGGTQNFFDDTTLGTPMSLDKRDRKPFAAALQHSTERSTGVTPTVGSFELCSVRAPVYSQKESSAKSQNGVGAIVAIKEAPKRPRVRLVLGQGAKLAATNGSDTSSRADQAPESYGSRQQIFLMSGPDSPTLVSSGDGVGVETQASILYPPTSRSGSCPSDDEGWASGAFQLEEGSARCSARRGQEHPGQSARRRQRQIAAGPRVMLSAVLEPGENCQRAAFASRTALTIKEKKSSSRKQSHDREGNAKTKEGNDFGEKPRLVLGGSSASAGATRQRSVDSSELPQVALNRVQDLGEEATKGGVAVPARALRAEGNWSGLEDSVCGATTQPQRCHDSAGKPAPTPGTVVAASQEAAAAAQLRLELRVRQTQANLCRVGVLEEVRRGNVWRRAQQLLAPTPGDGPLFSVPLEYREIHFPDGSPKACGGPAAQQGAEEQGGGERGGGATGPRVLEYRLHESPYLAAYRFLSEWPEWDNQPDGAGDSLFEDCVDGLRIEIELRLKDLVLQLEKRTEVEGHARHSGSKGDSFDDSDQVREQPVSAPIG